MKSTEWGLAFAPPNDENPLEDALGDALRQYGMKLIKPDAVEFSSALPESHRKNEKAYHVKAFRGSKEGYLFFLSTGILFGFKKPLAFFPLEAIESISYTSVLQRTFNLNIVYKEEGKEESEEVEFSMIGVEDHTGINDYVQRHGLHDASLAVARRAKMGKSKDKSSQQNAEGDEEEDGRTELEKVEQQLQDEEDEMEEDYDPDEDDDGTGSESEDDYKEGKGRDLVGEELGSEAEDVSDEDEEEDEDVEMSTPGGEEQQEGEVCDVTTSKDDDERKAHNAAANARNNPRPVTVRPKGEPDPEDEDQL
jgi:Histone chaperone Rttp106-like